MNHDPMVDEMKRRPPSRWAEVVRRAEILRHYAAVARPTVEDMRRCADELGCGQRQAYYYVRAWRARSSGLPDPRASEYAAPPKAPAEGEGHEAGTVTGDATPDDENAFPGVRPTGSERSDRTGERNRHETEVVVDCAPLAFDVFDGEMVEPARLLAILDKFDGRILAHALLAHEASSIDAEDVLLAWDGRQGAHVAWTAGVGDGFDFGRRAALAGAVPVPPGASAVPAGAALLDLVGGTLGRVRISPRRRGLSATPEAAIPMEAARTAIAHIVADRNEAILVPNDALRLP